MSQESLASPPVDHIELVYHVSSCVADLKGSLEDAAKKDAALFFTSFVFDEDVYAQPIVIPAKIANDLAAVVLKSDYMEPDAFVASIKHLLFLMRLNDTNPAPMEMHLAFLEMYERILHTGMQDKADEVAKLTELNVGDLVVLNIFISVEDGEVISGMRIVPNPIVAYEARKGLIIPDNSTVH